MALTNYRDRSIYDCSLGSPIGAMYRKWEVNLRATKTTESAARLVLQKSLQRVVDLESAVIADEAELAEFVHKEIDA